MRHRAFFVIGPGRLERLARLRVLEGMQQRHPLVEQRLRFRRATRRKIHFAQVRLHRIRLPRDRPASNQGRYQQTNSRDRHNYMPFCHCEPLLNVLNGPFYSSPVLLVS